MAIKPILFNTEMVRAILDRRKSCTRRIVKGFIPDDAVWGYTAFTPKGYISCRGTFTDGYGEKFFKLPCEPGDILYVRESVFQGVGRYLDVSGETVCVLTNDFEYYADGLHEKDHWKDKHEHTWMYRRPSINMPKEAARIWLKVTDVRVERLQSITEVGAKAEGAIDNRGFIHSPENEYDRIHTARENFIKIWNNTIKKFDIDRYGWDANPWVWVIEFERCEKPEGV
uniref:ASCH domain-containing protein n=1 Tax=Siphoviridae sp. ctLeh52 TaxID=2827849 RepID=A0A8S5RXM2_9CAUD|nr:MAG TPA: hypothetical protein [Siphoviridae sp. ctLeh52]